MPAQHVRKVIRPHAKQPQFHILVLEQDTFFAQYLKHENEQQLSV